MTVTGPLTPMRWAAVDRLIFDGRVPPAIEQKHIARKLQVEPDAAGAVAHQHHVTRVVAELFDRCVAPARGDLAVILGRAERRQPLPQLRRASAPTG